MEKISFEDAGQMLETVLLEEMLSEAKTHDEIFILSFAHMIAGYKLIASYLSASSKLQGLADLRTTLNNILDTIDYNALKKDENSH